MNAAEFNALYEVGVPVFAYPGARPEDIPSATRLVTRTRSVATVLSGHTDVVWVDGHSACIALTHVDVVSEGEFKVARSAETAAAVTELGALPVPVGPEPQRSVEDELAGARLSLWEEERENARLRARVAELEALTPAEIQTCRVCGAGYTYGQRCTTCEFRARMAAEIEGASGPSPEVSADKLTALLAPTQALREVPDGEHYPTVHHQYRTPHDLPETGGQSVNEAATVCRCDEPDADPYSCEADDCSGEFSELNPFGGGSGPVEGHDAKVSRTCGCGWQTSVWHVNDGSAEEELHGHVARVHGGVTPGVSL